jgi:hypothetical protein
VRSQRQAFNVPYVNLHPGLWSPPTNLTGKHPSGKGASRSDRPPLAIALVGCAKKTAPPPATIVGTWAHVKEGSLVKSDDYFQFGKDGRFEAGTKLEMKGRPLFGSDLKSAGASMTGTYRLHGDNVVVVLEGCTLKQTGEMTMPNPPAMLESPRRK